MHTEDAVDPAEVACVLQAKAEGGTGGFFTLISNRTGGET